MRRYYNHKFKKSKSIIESSWYYKEFSKPASSHANKVQFYTATTSCMRFSILLHVSVCGCGCFCFTTTKFCLYDLQTHSVFGGRVTDDTDLCDYEKNSNKLSSEIITQVILLLSFGIDILDYVTGIGNEIA